ncbi:MAG TPA: Fic family protein [Gemmatimonadales bacterium]
MKIPTKPPPFADILTSVLKSTGGPDRFQELLGAAVGPAPDGKYRHWDVVQHLAPPKGLTSKEFWLAMKMARHTLYQLLPLKDVKGQPFRFAVTDGVFRKLSEIDRRLGGTLGATDQITNPQVRDTYLITSLIEEAITSSQLEGASTTREVAKEMIQTGRAPRDRSEMMIHNNYLAMEFIRDLGDQALTPAVVIELQRMLTDGAIDDPGAAGRLRRADESIAVVDPIVGTVLHIPPAAEQLEARMKVMCEFANAEDDEKRFMHPVIRAVLLHLWLGYDHPFVDGNGRTARALFYWSMARRGYWLSEFISISSILKKAPSAYSKAYLYTETDDNDATYFILYQLHVIARAIDALYAYLERKRRELQEVDAMLRRSRLIRDELNHRQLALINHALKHPLAEYTINSHRRSHNISYQTARTDLLELASHHLLDGGKSGRAFVFTVPPDLQARLKRLTQGRASA